MRTNLSLQCYFNTNFNLMKYNLNNLRDGISEE